MGSRLLRPCQHHFKFFQEFGNVTSPNDEGRKKPQNVVVRAIYDEAATKRLLDIRCAVDSEIDADDQALAADFANEIETRGELFEAGAKFRAALPNVSEKLLFFDNRQEFKRCRADQRAATERRAVHAGSKCRGKFFIRDDCAKRKATSNRFRDRHDVGGRGKLLISEISAGAAKAALNLVGNDGSVVFGRQIARS